MSSSRSVFLSKAIAGSTLLVALAGVSACTSVPATQSLAIQAPSHAADRISYADASGDGPQPVVSQNAQADYMPVGEAVAAPAGFLDLCERSPADCSHSTVYNPEKIRIEARVAMVERYKLAFAALKNGRQLGGEGDQQTAAVASAGNGPATADTVHYLTWPAQTEVQTEIRTQVQAPLSYVQPLRNAASSLSGSRLSLPGIGTPAAKGYISDFLDLSVDAHGWTELSSVTSRGTGLSLAGEVQPGAITSEDDGVSRLNWANKTSNEFDYGSIPAAAVTEISASQLDAPSIQYDLPQAPYDWAHLHIGTPANAQLAEQQADSAAAPADYLRIDMRGAVARTVRSVNDEVNRVLRGATDEQVYHVADYWNAPDLAPGARGDCEDYALEKRRLLIQNGIPAASLSIAIVRTRIGDEHAVLIVSSRQGDFVLDNLQYDVRAWRHAGYDWISRQGPGDDLGWVSLAPANTSPSPWQARTVRIAYTQ